MLGNVKRIIKDDISNGKSFRISCFISGCDGVIYNKKTKKYDHCPGCFNSETWSFNVGTPVQNCIDEIVESLKPEHINGLSILGGEPMSIKNQETTAYIINKVRNEFNNKKSIWLWTGFIYSKNIFNKNRIPHTKWTDYILKNVDVLIDGPFIADKFDIDLKYKGSSNQRVLHLR